MGTVTFMEGSSDLDSCTRNGLMLSIAILKAYISELSLEVLAAHTEMNGIYRDAERYRWLRAQHWSGHTLCVVADPKNSVRLGSFCPDRELLDDAIDKELNEYHTCRRCGGTLRPGIALEQDMIGYPDFIGDTDCVTISHSSTAHITECLKCEKCGHSVTGVKKWPLFHT